MFIVPFIENSFKHGVSDETENAWISIDLEVRGNSFTIKVDNSKSKILATDDLNYKEGIGLKNVKRRLELLYPGKCELKTMDTDESYLVILKLELNGD